MAIAIALAGGNAWALIVEGGPSVNTTSAGFNSVFYNVGRVSNGSLVYLGDGWALSAGHVTLPAPQGEIAEFGLPGLPTQNILVEKHDPFAELLARRHHGPSGSAAHSACAGSGSAFDFSKHRDEQPNHRQRRGNGRHR